MRLEKVKWLKIKALECKEKLLKNKINYWKMITRKYFLISFSLVPETIRVFGRLSIFRELIDLGNGTGLLFAFSPISCADSLRPSALA